MSTPLDDPSGRQILQSTSQAGKSYEFDENHDVRRPVAWWFQESNEGLILFLVFYTRACRWSRCTACNLPSTCSPHYIDYHAIIGQIDHILNDAAVMPMMANIRKLIISNNGSVLDEATFPSTALMYLLAQINLKFPRLNVISMETRAEYVDFDELEFMSRAMRERESPADFELAIGFEAFDDHVRNKVFRKGLSLQDFECLVRKVARPHFRLKCYFMQKPVTNMSDEEAIEDIRRGIDYLSRLADRHGVAINMHLNPTFVARGTPLETAFLNGDYEPPRLSDVVKAVLYGRNRSISIFVGLSDEGLAVQGGSFLRTGDKKIVQALDSFNRTQDYDALETLGIAKSPQSTATTHRQDPTAPP